jgi:hypothetical protein
MDIMNWMKSSLALAALSFALLGVTGCANLQQPAPAPALAPEEVHVSVEHTGLMVSIYHPDTRTMFVWLGDPRPVAKMPMICLELQLSEDPGLPPKGLTCPFSASASAPTIPGGTPLHLPASPPPSAPASAPPSGH